MKGKKQKQNKRKEKKCISLVKTIGAHQIVSIRVAWWELICDDFVMYENSGSN